MSPSLPSGLSPFSDFVAGLWAKGKPGGRSEKEMDEALNLGELGATGESSKEGLDAVGENKELEKTGWVVWDFSVRVDSGAVEEWLTRNSSKWGFDETWSTSGGVG
jgi:hypothetical protein